MEVAEAVVEAQTGDVVLPRPPSPGVDDPVAAEAPEVVGERPVIGRDHAALHGRHRLNRVEREDAHFRSRTVANGTVAGLGADGMRRILDHDPRAVAETLQIDGQAGVMDRDEGVGSRARGAGRD